MNFFQRAIKNVTRRKTKSILLVLTFFLIGNLVIIGLGVANASENAKVLTRQKMRAVVSYTIDYRKVDEYIQSLTDQDEIDNFYKDYPRVKLGDVATFLNDERVKSANALYTGMWYSDSENSLDFVHLNNERENNLNGGGVVYAEDDMVIQETYKEPYFFIKGNFFPSMIEFADGDFSLVKGRFYTQEEIDDAKQVCLISENLAKTNNLDVGDYVRFSTDNLGEYLTSMGITNDMVEVEFEVIGIFTHNSPVTPDNPNFDYMAPYENPDNMIFMPGTAEYMCQLDKLVKQYEYNEQMYGQEEWWSNNEPKPSAENMERNVYIDNVTLLINDPLEVDKFVEEYNKTLTDFTTLTANNEEFNRLSKPLDTLSMYAGFIVWLVVINAVVIITLVTALTLKTREFEIGVLLSIGAAKFKVISQFFVELALVALVGFSLSIVSGSVVAKNLGNKVLEYQIASSDVQEDDEMILYKMSSSYNPWDTNYTTDISLDDLVAEYEVRISPLIIGEIYAFGLGIVFVSVLIPSFMIMRYNPKKILMNQG